MSSRPDNSSQSGTGYSKCPWGSYGKASTSLSVHTRAPTFDFFILHLILSYGFLSLQQGAGGFREAQGVKRGMAYRQLDMGIRGHGMILLGLLSALLHDIHRDFHRELWHKVIIQNQFTLPLLRISGILLVHYTASVASVCAWWQVCVVGERAYQANLGIPLST